ncbi:MAG: NAD(P)-dependent dehydrogenase (short-subunit alcohol dehydrogenase family) [Parvicella sp.]|jgi:gluconate 5-dehydrogenase
MEVSSVCSVSPTGKTIIVTGGYGHLGAAITESLAYHGANVYVLGRSVEKFNSALNSCVQKDRIHFLKGDIASNESLTKAFIEVTEKEGAIDGIINNAFYASGQSPDTMDREDFNYTLDGTLTSVFESIKLSIPYLSNNASIANVSSMYGLVAPDFDAYENCPQFLNPPHYGAAKAGVIQLSKYYASFLGKKGIRVNAVSPGPFPSSEVQKNDNFMKELSKRTLLNRIGLPHELAGVFVFLMSESSRFITGQNFVVDGGWTVR